MRIKGYTEGSIAMVGNKLIPPKKDFFNPQKNSWKMPFRGQRYDRKFSLDLMTSTHKLFKIFFYVKNNLLTVKYVFIIFEVKKLNCQIFFKQIIIFGGKTSPESNAPKRPPGLSSNVKILFNKEVEICRI